MGSIKAGVGTTVKIGTSSGSATAIAKLLTIGGPSISAESVEVTSLDSTGGYKEWISGLRQGGEVQLDLYWQKGNTAQQLIRDALDAGTRLWMYIEWPTSPLDGVQFYCNVGSFGANTTANEGIKASVGITLDGPPTWGPMGGVVYDASSSRHGYSIDSGTIWNGGGTASEAATVGYAYGVYNWYGMTFPTVTVPHYATIASAVLTMGTFSWQSGDPITGNMKVEYEDQPTQWGASGHCPGVGGVNYYGTVIPVTGFTLGIATQVDVTALVQAQVNRAGWASGNRMNFAYMATNAVTAGFGTFDPPAHLLVLAT